MGLLVGHEFTFRGYNLNVIERCQISGQREVYKCLDELKNGYAYKIGEITSTSSLKRLQQEIGFSKQNQSQYFPKLYDIDIDLIGEKYFILEEFIEGTPLNKCLYRFNEEEKIIKLFSKLLEGLNVLWEQNIIHRDIKPANIIIRENDEPVILDLGIARFLDYSSLTPTEAPRGPGTYAYAAPEQLKNEKDIINLRTDIFILGILLLELYLGYYPLKNSRDIFSDIISGNFPTTGNSKIDNLLGKMLNPKPFKRFKSYQQIKKYIVENWGEY